ncbi:hypothetical protein B0A49_07662 [Cryomyces minteri]|uniref:Uncharacterized protein n=1 Tax=Cryomyces minteri TaxID=331657 RepID=A0A4U0X0R2_9PEZI|nr:hypothetical protein B0A49_07662 [Cryomyces minteri]
MKRKFSFGLPPLKFGPSKSDTEALKEALASQNVPPSPSPMIVDRRPLSPQTELELRQSCATILQDFKPSSQLYEEQLLAQRAKPLDYDAIKSSARPMGSDHTGRKGSRFNPNDLPEVFHTPEGREDNPYAYKPKTALEDLFPEQDSTHELIKANMSRRMEQPRTIPAQPPPTARTMSKDDRMDKHDSGKVVKHRTLSGDRPKAASRVDSGETCSSTPQTGSTDLPWAASTAPTSAALTPSRSSKRASQQMTFDQDTASRADAAAVEWMKQELEKRRREAPSPPRERRERRERREHREHREQPIRPPSRTRSITSEIKEYIRPGSAAGVRSPSRDSQRSTDESRGLASGWRSWGFNRRNSSRTRDNRPDSAAGSEERSDDTRGRQTTKRSVNLNRELPPLPGLDKWKETEQELEPQPVATTHIANLMSSRSKSGTRPKVSTAASNTETKTAPAREHKSQTVEARLDEPIQTVKSKPRSNAASRSDYQLPMRPGTAKPTPATTRSPPNPDYSFENIASAPTASAKKTWRRSTAPDFPSELTSQPSTTTSARNGPLRDASNSNSTRHSPSHSHSQQGAKDNAPLLSAHPLPRT